ncbi:hypothetical protein [Streptomyces sp. TRM70350]|uniref:hypothetical protein n=1 Tax=Streptomyces sp. TRM70350 TaxID=2856165 RepID=UPI001C455156|nr:hypothetical protein [Streptomyces sp. TRM70350]MBV7697831.1 hypothetical protein [Streptomyces sp. TRM70350]
MWKRRKAARSPREDRVELCDVCAAVFPASEAVSGYVPDSSSTHETNDWFDGLRRVTACCDAHFCAIKEKYRRRPFIEEELWAAKITRVLTSGPPVRTVEQLACRTGLGEPEIRRAVAWHNERRRRLSES